MQATIQTSQVPSSQTVTGVQNGANSHDSANNGTVFMVSSDLFTFSGLVNAEDGIPALRTWAITQTDRIGQVQTST